MKDREIKAFTSIELIIVTAVIGVLAAILIPVFANVCDRANEASALSDAHYTASRLIAEAEKDASIPEDLPIPVRKADQLHLYGCNTKQGNIIKSSKGNPIGRFSDAESINDRYGMSDAKASELTQSYSFGENSAFYLFPNDKGNISADFNKRYTNVTAKYDWAAKINTGEILVYNGVLLDGTFTFINDAQTTVGAVPHSSPSPDPSESRDVTISVTDTENGDSVQITYNMAGNTVYAADIADKCDAVMPYFMPDSETYTVSDDHAHITGTRLAKKDGTKYSKYTSQGSMIYSSSDENCFYVISSKEGFMSISDDMTARYAVFADDGIDLGDINAFGSFGGVLDG